ncbi:hypothetical protein ZIOFF_074782 [Zingiber officinale]|uniref:Uncharacterized protein n=1 Tax=Zingiber officinale TaxID=94328 RepID=A0A8J5ERX7_ZINOF|nr:hypothetical protein ZIOFF_074782 [Zingiber officinale]
MGRNQEVFRVKKEGGVGGGKAPLFEIDDWGAAKKSSMSESRETVGGGRAPLFESHSRADEFDGWISTKIDAPSRADSCGRSRDRMRTTSNQSKVFAKNGQEWKESNIDSTLDEEVESSITEDLMVCCYMDGVDRKDHPICYNVSGVFQNDPLYLKTFGSKGRERFLVEGSDDARGNPAA